MVDSSMGGRMFRNSVNIVVVVAAAGPWSQLAAQEVTDSLFRTADACMVCHNNLTSRAGVDISIGFDWRSSMMANSGRDPYWQAGVRREVMDHPGASEAIQDKCSTCHMPMARYMAHAHGGSGDVFGNLPVGSGSESSAVLAADGVSCTVCHQVSAAGLDDPASFSGGFAVDSATVLGRRSVYGPFEVDGGRKRVMMSASGFEPKESEHIQSSALCGSCHTLFTHPLNDDGEELAEFPEQTPYLEWLHSDYRGERSCQSCHMPEADGAAPVTGVLGEERENVSRHVFRGGNFFLPRLLNRYRGELGVSALTQELEATASRSAEHLRTRAATVAVTSVVETAEGLTFDVEVVNLAGHKLPSAYPSRRAWLHVVVRDADGHAVFESGALRGDGSIVGNDNDVDPGSYEQHYAHIEEPGQVQVYEAIMEHYDGGPTTGLLNAVRYLKDNRILPRGFNKATAGAAIAVAGGAHTDENFRGGSDRVSYHVAVDNGRAPFSIAVELLYQPVAFRWAQNLADYDAFEPRRFVRYYEAMAASSSQLLARGTGSTPRSQSR
jgi:hypothetical protein